MWGSRILGYLIKITKDIYFNPKDFMAGIKFYRGKEKTP